jgi:tetratricopeptide (TPR) repeat protein
MGKIRESVACYRMVAKLEPDNVEAWLDYGETLVELGLLKQALKAFDQAVRVNPQLAEPHYSRAKVLLVLDRGVEALESLKAAVALDPGKQTEFEDDFPAVRSMKEYRSLFRR